MTRELHLAAALDGAGWHPAAWRSPGARPGELSTARYWADVVAEAERGALDLVTFEDALSPQSSAADGPDERTDQVRGRLDAVLVASAVAPLTRRIGLVPTVVATHTEPFHIAKAVATLDFTSHGRAGVRVRLSDSVAENAHFGRRDPAEFAPAGQPELLAEVGEHVEVQRRLWDSWEDDAEIRDEATGRFVDRDKLHYIDYAGPRFSVRGPSITPRSPQAQPPVAMLAHHDAVYRLAAASADLVFVTPSTVDEARATAARLAELRAEHTDQPLSVFADLVVFLDDTARAAAGRRARLDAADGAEYVCDARIFTGTPAELADELETLADAGLAGFRLRPAEIPHDLTAVTRALVPELQARGRFRRDYAEDTLRARLGLARPANRYAGATP